MVLTLLDHTVIFHDRADRPHGIIIEQRGDVLAVKVPGYSYIVTDPPQRKYVPSHYIILRLLGAPLDDGRQRGEEIISFPTRPARVMLR